MVLSKRVGTILREAREARKLSIKDVARETNITPRYVDALENEDYSVFPGETYALGFLRSYSEYLHLDTEHLLNLYRGHQIDLSQAPVKELTRPTGGMGLRMPSISMPSVSLPGMPAVNPRVISLGIGVALVVGVIALFASGVIPLPEISGPGGNDGAAAFCDDPSREIMATTLPQQGGQPRQVDVDTSNTLRFAADSLSLKFCLHKIDKNPGQPPRGEFRLRINDDQNYAFSALLGETVTLSPEIGVFEGLSREIKITPRVLSDISASVEFRVEGAEVAAVTTPDGTTEPVQKAACEIKVTLEFVRDSYFQWSKDGDSHQGRTIAAGERRALEADSRLQIRVGNGGGVMIYRDGDQQGRVAGPPGKIVEIEYRRVPDQLDPGLCKVDEIIRVAQ